MSTSAQTSPSPPSGAILLLACGFAALAIAFGVRTTFGFFLPPITQSTGWSIGMLSLALAVQNLVWGAAQPFTGALSDSRGAAPVVAGGAAVYAAGLVVMALVPHPGAFLLGAGVLVGIGQAAIGFPVLLGAIGRAATPARRSLYLGIATAGGSFGQLLFAPIGPRLLEATAWQDALLILAVICLGAAGAASVGIAAGSRRGTPAPAVSSTPEPLGRALRGAARHRGFLLLNAGFFVCGFQLAFITFHLPAFAGLCGLTAGAAATGLALIGGFNIFGTILAGRLGGLYRAKFPLSLIYLGRAVACLAMVTLPVTEPLLYGFAIAMGLLWLSTVPLTSGLVGQIFGPRHVGALFGIVFFSHQVGSFLGVWLAGRLFDATGSYDIVWWLSAALGLMAALVHLPIDDRRVETAAPAAA
jgi:MFS family permease